MVFDDKSPIEVKGKRKTIGAFTSMLRAESGREFDPSPGNSSSQLQETIGVDNS